MVQSLSQRENGELPFEPALVNTGVPEAPTPAAELSVDVTRDEVFDSPAKFDEDIEVSGDFDPSADQDQTLYDSDDDEPQTLGGVLRKARLARGAKPLVDIATELRIRPHLLEALETDDYDKLPGVIYAAGFLRTYANYLGLDAGVLVERLKESGQARPLEAPLVFPEPLNDPRIPGKALVGLAAVLCLAVYGAWYSFSEKDVGSLEAVAKPRPEITALAVRDEPVAAPQQPAFAAPMTPAVTETPSDVANETALAAGDATTATTPTDAVVGDQTAPVAAADMAGEGGGITLKATADAWIRIEGPDDKTVVEKILKAGETLKAPANQGFKMMTGNAGALEFLIDGEVFGQLGPIGAVRRDIKLDVAMLKTTLQR